MSSYQNPFQIGDIVAPVEESAAGIPTAGVNVDQRHDNKIGKTTVVMAVSPNELWWGGSMTYHGIRVLCIAYQDGEWSNPAFFRFVERPRAPSVSTKLDKPIVFHLDPTVNDGHTCTGELPF